MCEFFGKVYTIPRLSVAPGGRVFPFRWQRFGKTDTEISKKGKYVFTIWKTCVKMYLVKIGVCAIIFR